MHSVVDGISTRAHHRRSKQMMLIALIIALLAPVIQGFSRFSSLPRARLSVQLVAYPVPLVPLTRNGMQRIPKSCRTSRNALQVPSFVSSLHNDPSYCLTAVLLLSTFGISLERRTVVGKALSAPLATMALALLIANVGIIPFSSPVYAAMNKYAVSLAVPMLLYDSNLRRVLSDTGTVLIAFLVGALATVVGTLVAFPLLPMRALGLNNGYKVACALAARHIGGAINFVAVAETMRIPGTVVSAAIAADNVVVALYFAFLFALAKADSEIDGDTSAVPAKAIETELDYSLDGITKKNDTVVVEPDKKEISLATISLAIAVASSLVTVGKALTQLLLPPGTSALPITSTITVIGATLFPKFFTQIRTAGTAVGILFIQMFFAASGAAGSIALVFKQAPSLFVFSALQIAIHFLFLLVLGRGVLGLPPNELYLASNANVGGPTTAAAMAQAKNWTRLVLPALLVGILGYATATGIALALGPILVRLPILGR
jgi:uncharacterized membrane protein